MSFWNLNTITALIFIAVILFLLWKDRKNIERHGIIFLRRTEKGIKILEKIASCCPKFWKILSTFGVFIGFSGSVFVFFYLLGNIINSFISVQTQPALSLVLPTLSTNFKMLPGVFLTPFWYWIIAIFFMVVVHEGMHGIIGLVERFKLNSVGWAVLGFIPAAFVEPEGEENIHTKKEKKFRKKEREKIKVEGGWQGGTLISRLRVLSAGSLGNFILAGLLALLIISTTTTAYGGREINGLFVHKGVMIIGVANNSAAEKYGIHPNLTITKVNGFKIKSIADFSRILDSVNSGSNVTLGNSNVTYNLIAGKYPKLNLTYNAKYSDYIMAYLERIFPIIEITGKNENPLVKLSKWKWIKNNFNFLNKKAELRISQIQKELNKKAYLGVSVSNYGHINEKVRPFFSAIFFIYGLISFMVVINLGIGLANLLPLKPLDGGLLWENLFEKISPKYGRRITLFLGILTLILIILSFGSSFL